MALYHVKATFIVLKRQRLVENNHQNGMWQQLEAHGRQQVFRVLDSALKAMGDPGVCRREHFGLRRDAQLRAGKYFHHQLEVQFQKAGKGGCNGEASFYAVQNRRVESRQFEQIDDSKKRDRVEGTDVVFEFVYDVNFKIFTQSYFASFHGREEYLAR